MWLFYFQPCGVNVTTQVATPMRSTRRRVFGNVAQHVVALYPPWNRVRTSRRILMVGRRRWRRRRIRRRRAQLLLAYTVAGKGSRHRSRVTIITRRIITYAPHACQAELNRTKNTQAPSISDTLANLDEACSEHYSHAANAARMLQFSEDGC